MVDEEIRRALLRVVTQAFPDIRVYDWRGRGPEQEGPHCQRCGCGVAWVVRESAGNAVLLALCAMCTKAVARTGKLDGLEPRAEPVTFELNLDMLDAPNPPHGFESDSDSPEWWVCSLCREPIYDPTHRDDKFLADVVEKLTRHIDRAVGLKHEYLEALTAAYLLKTKTPPEGVELVQQVVGGTIYFWFRPQVESKDVAEAVARLTHTYEVSAVLDELARQVEGAGDGTLRNMLMGAADVARDEERALRLKLEGQRDGEEEGKEPAGPGEEERDAGAGREDNTGHEPADG